MAAGSVLAQFNASDLFRETSTGYDTRFQTAVYQTANGGTRGLSLQKFLIAGQIVEYYNGIWYVPSSIALATGLTHKLVIVDDGANSADLGLVVRLGITPYNLSTALSVVDFSLAASKGTETFVNVTLGATTGLPVIASIPIVVANLASLAAGSIYGMRIRRVGDNAADTCANRVILLGGQVNDT
jgi:hypothetical protein